MNSVNPSTLRAVLSPIVDTMKSMRYIFLSGCLLLVPSAGAQSVDVPEWAKEAVWYQIFPERFRNGDPSNDPTLADIRGSWPHLQPESWAIAEWTSDWYRQPAWERAVSDDFYLTVQLRRYGGDLQGIIDQIDYLDSLGVNAIYLNPIFMSPSLHKYDGSLFHHVDPTFGPDPTYDRGLIAEEDPLDPGTWVWTGADRLFLNLVDSLHTRGMRIVIDGVFNHMGLRSFAFEDVRARGQASRFADWFTILEWDDPSTPKDELDYVGWLGVRELPELREDDNGLIPPIRDYVFASVARWMQPVVDGQARKGVDGWRLDVAEMVNMSFWQDLRQHVRSMKPDAYLVGEVWWEDWPNRMYNARPWLEGDAFDAVMNYRWARAARRLFLGSDLDPGEAYGPSRFADDIDALRADYPSEVNFVMMNTISTHDTDRVASQALNRDFRFDHRAKPSDDPGYRVHSPGASDRRDVRLLLAQQFTHVGAPHLFYGDEAGMWGADDPDERKPMWWSDLSFEAESEHPLGLERPADPVAFDHEMFAYYRRLIEVRRSSLALSRGDLTFLLTEDESGLLAYERAFGEERAWVMFNLSSESRTVMLPVQTELPAAGHATPARSLNGRIVRDALSGEVTRLGAEGIRAEYPPRSVRIWVLEQGSGFGF